MPDFDINSVLSQFGGAEAPKSKVSTFDIDSILKSFSSVETEAPKEEVKKVVIRTPKPPISGISKEASDELNQTRVERFGGENPRAKLPTTSIQESAYDADVAGKALASEGAADFSSGHPYKGAGKVALGLASRLFSPVTGIIEGGVSKPIADITGSKDIGDRAGFVVGSAIPLDMGLGAVSKVAAGLPVVSKLSSYTKNRALSNLVESIGPENLPSVVSQMKANPRLAPADLSPKVLQDTQHLFANDGPQINYLAKTSGDRMGSSKNAIEAAYDTSAGVSVDLAKKVDDLAKASKAVGNQKIQPAINAAGPVDISSTLTAIDNVLKPGVLKIGDSVPLTAVKKELENIRKSLRTSKEYAAKDLHSFQSGLRSTAERLLRSATGGDKEVGQALMNVRNSLVSDIDKASGGKYKPALSSYRDEMHIADAFKEGYDGLFASSKKMENTPSFVKQWFEGLTDAEKQAAREGARASIATEIGVAKNPALAGERLSRSDFNKEKLEILFGKDEAGKLIKALEDERAIANTHNKIVEGSQTQMRAASKAQFEMPTATEVMKSGPAVAAAEASNYFMGGAPGFGSLALAGAKGGAMLKDSIKMKIARENNAQYAKYALPTEGPSRDELIKALEARIPGPKQNLLTRGANSLSRIVSP